MMFTEKDGWRNEDSEGPYTETLRTFYDWKNQTCYKIVRLSSDARGLFNLSWNGNLNPLKFDTIEKCKETVALHIAGEFK